MKKIKFIVIFILIFFIFPIIEEIFKINNVYANSEDIYDVILFWGQSNMVGTCGMLEEEKIKDRRYEWRDDESVSKFCEITGIEFEIVKYTGVMNHTQVFLESKTGFEYRVLTNSLEELTNKTTILGENVKYNIETNNLELATDNLYDLQESYGTNMIPYFCKEYYKKTGHKVIAVLAANGGKRIETFLPHEDEDYISYQSESYREPILPTDYAAYIYESMVEKYNSAISYMKKNGYIIGNKLYVCFQGEGNARLNTETEQYKRVYKKIHDRLKMDTGITKGAIIYTARDIGVSKYFEGVKNIHQAQEELILENSDIILGSSYPYSRYVPDEKNYYSDDYNNEIFVDENGEKLSYDVAFKNASYSVCYPNNTVHFTSASLAQIGKETADQFSEINKIEVNKNPTKMVYIQNHDELDLSGGKLKIVYNNGTENSIDLDNIEIKIDGFNNNCIGKNKLDIFYKGYSSELYVNIVPKPKEIEDKINLIADFDIGMLVKEVKSDERFLEYNIKIFDEHNNEIPIEVDVSTGNILRIFDENGILLIEYKIVIYGDVNGDSNVNSVDALMIIKNRLGINVMKNSIYEEAGRVTDNTRNSNLVPNACDALAIIKYKLNNQYKINQNLFIDNQ